MTIILPDAAPQLVTKGALILEQKSYFSRLATVVTRQCVILADHTGYRSVQIGIRVSVLDLDNTMFSAGRRMNGRGNNHVIRSLSDRSPPAPNRGGSLTRDHQQCCYCISLYDVNDGEFPEGNSPRRCSGFPEEICGSPPSIRRSNAAYQRLMIISYLFSDCVLCSLLRLSQFAAQITAGSFRLIAWRLSYGGA